IKARQPGDAALRGGWTLWGSWLLVTGLVFSYAQGIWHPYYTTMLAPAIAAISAAGIAVLWRHYRDGDGAAWVLLPLAIAMTAAGPGNGFGGGGRGRLPRGVPQGIEQEVSQLLDEARLGRLNIGGLMGNGLTSEQQKTLAYAKQHSGGAAITLAVEGGAMAA